MQKIKAPTMVKQCKSFAGMVNFVSIFCSELQKLLKPIYDVTRKGRQFVWGLEQQNAFEEIKEAFQKPPVLHMPDNVGRFQLYSDTSKYAMRSALYQIQNGKPRLITCKQEITRSSMKFFHYRVGNVWIGNKILLVFCTY